jgi:hypothetical protein
MLSLIWLNLKKGQYFDPFALIISSVVLDLEPLLVMIFDLPYFHHGFWHSYFASLLVSAFLAPALYLIERRYTDTMTKIHVFFRLNGHLPYGLKLIFMNVMIGLGFHVFLDSFTHKTLPYVLFPVYVSSTNGNVFWFGLDVAILAEFVAVCLSLLSCGLWIKTYLSRRQQ